jgi:uncharacterized protein
MKPQLTKAKPAFISRSPETGSDYTIYVDVPAANGPFAPVFLMDGDFFFDAGVQAGRALAKSKSIPPAIMIGVGYGAGFGKPGNFRGRDYTPTASADEPSSGGADRFLAYLTKTLWPEIARRYPVSHAGRVIAGHSLGSLLVLHALFQEQPFFDRALASAPSIWWDDRSILGVASRLRDRTGDLSAKLYVGVGANDSPSMLGDIALLRDQLNKRPFRNLLVDCEKFPNHDHYDVVPFTLTSGLATLLA